MNNEIVKFKDGLFELDVAVTPEKETVWLTQEQISELFDTARSSIAYHIGKIFKEGELEKNTSVEIFDRSKNMASRPPKYYNLDVIISVGYRVKSQRGIQFRKWATDILKQYMLQGYAVNHHRLKALNRVVKIQSDIIAGIVGIDSEDVLKVVQEYSRSLELLDSYDHQNISVPKGSECVYQLDYDECMTIIEKMDFGKTSAIFGTEKEQGKLHGILAVIHQSAFGEDVYPTLEEKAANLLYFLIKDHPFTDGCKRIAATLFLYFLDKNKALYRDDNKIISDSALVAITLMIAESDPQEKNIMVQVVMNFLHW